MRIADILDCPSLLRAMIQFNTVTPHVSGRYDAERPLAEWLASAGEAWGMTARWLPVPDAADNLLLTFEQAGDRRWLLFDSHLDTVDTAGMTIDPLGGEIRDGKLYGRGACDTKGTGAAMLWAARQAIASNEAVSNLAILFSVGEEHCQIGAQAFCNDSLPQLGWRPDLVIVGEPTRMRVVAASNGFVRWRVTTHGVAAHSSTPQLGHNAIHDMARVITAIEQHHIQPLNATHPLTGKASCSVNGIHGGVQHNIVPERCEIQIDQRLIPGQTPDEAVQSATRAIDSLRDTHPRLRYEFSHVESAPPYASDALLAVGQEVASYLTDAGISSEVIGAPYTTNANHYANELPALVLGPGDIAQAHTKDEWISLEQLELGVSGYRALMQRPC